MLKPVRLLLLAFACLTASAVSAQTFTANPAAAIPDSNYEVRYPVLVSGLPTVVDTSFGLLSVCFNITHSYVGDLDMVLQDPSGLRQLMFSHVGGSGDNFSGTCLTNDAVGLITNASAPFAGVYRPQSDLNGYNSGTNPNGTWYLILKDRIRGDAGRINTFSITFGANPPVAPPPPPSPCSFTNMLSCECPDGSDDCDLLPDMTASTRIIVDQHYETPGWIRASNGTPNIGYGPMEIHGTGVCYCDSVQVPCGSPCPSGIRESVEQTIYHKSGSTYTTWRRPAGYMAYHPSHGHVHLDSYARFSLRQRGPDPDPRTWPILGTGNKVSYCLVNVATCTNANGYCQDDSGRVLNYDDIPNAGLGMTSGCARDQGVHVGKLDIYGSSNPGHEVDLTGLCNGTYYLVSETDPSNVLLEISEDNNLSVAQVTLTQQPAPTPTPFTGRMVSAFQLAAAAMIPDGRRFTWDFGDGETDTSNAIVVHTYAGPGIYTVRLTIHHMCGDTSTAQVFTIIATRTAATPAELSLKAEPNPAHGSFKLSCRKVSAAPATARITDLAGRTLRSLPIEGPAGKFETQVSTADLPAGLYLLQLETGLGSAAVRLVVE